MKLDPRDVAEAAEEILTWADEHDYGPATFTEAVGIYIKHHAHQSEPIPTPQEQRSPAECGAVGTGSTPEAPTDAPYGYESWCEGHPDSPDPKRAGGYGRPIPAPTGVWPSLQAIQNIGNIGYIAAEAIRASFIAPLLARAEKAEERARYWEARTEEEKRNRSDCFYIQKSKIEKAEAERDDARRIADVRGDQLKVANAECGMLEKKAAESAAVASVTREEILKAMLCGETDIPLDEFEREADAVLALLASKSKEASKAEAGITTKKIGDALDDWFGDEVHQQISYESVRALENFLADRFSGRVAAPAPAGGLSRETAERLIVDAKALQDRVRNSKKTPDDFVFKGYAVSIMDAEAELAAPRKEELVGRMVTIRDEYPEDIIVGRSEVRRGRVVAVLPETSEKGAEA